MSFPISEETAPQFFHFNAALFLPALDSGLVCSPPLWFPYVAFRNPSVSLREKSGFLEGLNRDQEILSSRLAGWQKHHWKSRAFFPFV